MRIEVEREKLSASRVPERVSIMAVGGASVPLKVTCRGPLNSIPDLLDGITIE